MLTDRIIGAATIVVAAVYLYATAQIPTLEIGDPLGPKAFPDLLGIALIAAALLLFFESRKGCGEDDDVAGFGDGRHLWLIGAVTLWTAGYFWVFERAGYVVATTGYLLALTFVFNRGRWLANVLTSVLFAAGSYGLFVKVLGVTLPAGVLAL